MKRQHGESPDQNGTPQMVSHEVDSYRLAGVDYGVLDASKREAILLASQTSNFACSRGASAIPESRGESAFVFQRESEHWALVMECLGTKSSIAVEYLREAGVDLFENVGYDTVAAAVNDLLCVGALPLVVNAYMATGAPAWFVNDGRHGSILRGWHAACRDSGAMWGGGESPMLPGIVDAEQIDLAVSTVGVLPKGRHPLLGSDIRPGADIVFLASSGIHTNGLSLARSVAAQSPDGYMTKLESGISYGEALLRGSTIYVSVIDALLQQGSTLQYISHITGHGLRKLMRPAMPFTYRISKLPPVPEVLQFIVDRSGMSPQDAYATLNMGVGMAIYCEAGSGETVAKFATENGVSAAHVGSVEAGEKRVILEPLGIEYHGEQLQLR